jgi:O-antigen/teichoic acid export membrane protein
VTSEPARTAKPIEVDARHMTRDVAIQIVARILNLALGVVVTLVLVRGLGAHDFGIWSTLFAVTQIASSFGELGLSSITVSRAAADPEHESLWLGALLQLRTVLVIPITLGSLIGVLLIAPSAHARLAGVLIACVALVGVPGAVSVVFQLRVRNDISMGLLTTNSILWALAVVGVSALSGGIVAFAVAFLVTNALTTGLTFVFARKHARISLRKARRLWGTLLRVGVGVGIGGILVTSYVKLDQILVFEFAGSRQAGLYGAAYRLLESVQFIPISVMTTLFPLIASAYRSRRERAFALLQAAAEYLTMASLPILAFTIVAASPIMAFLFGRQFVAASPALPVLAGAFISISFGYLVGNMVVILELQRAFVRYAAVGLVLNAVLNVLLIPRYGFQAAAWVTVVTEFTVMSQAMRKVLSTLGMTPAVGRLLRTFAAAAAMGAITWLARIAGLPLGALAAVAALSYFPFLLALGVITPAEVVSVLRKEPPAAREEPDPSASSGNQSSLSSMP